MASRRHRRKQQRQRRQARFVKRVEFILSSDGEQADRDRAIFEHLAALTARGEASEWIKATLYAALAGTHAPVRPQEARHEAASRDVVLMLAREVASLKQQVGAQERAPARPAPQDADQPVTESTGIDMSGPRRRNGRPPTAATSTSAPARPATPPPTNPALLLAASIRTASAQLAGRT